MEVKGNNAKNDLSLSVFLSVLTLLTWNFCIHFLDQVMQIFWLF